MRSDRLRGNLAEPLPDLIRALFVEKSLVLSVYVVGKPSISRCPLGLVRSPVGVPFRVLIESEIRRDQRGRIRRLPGRDLSREIESAISGAGSP